jgi:hypothetical protein
MKEPFKAQAKELLDALSYDHADDPENIEESTQLLVEALTGACHIGSVIEMEAWEEDVEAWTRAIGKLPKDRVFRPADVLEVLNFIKQSVHPGEDYQGPSNPDKKDFDASLKQCQDFLQTLGQGKYRDKV